MGLGLHGGGVASARYCAEAGARVTVTDLGSPERLAPSVAQLRDLDVRFVLERHDPEDFDTADIVIKNPAVPRSAALLKRARRVETDLSIFLAQHRGFRVAVTGTKGKSSTASLIHHLILGLHPSAKLGGNITLSPLSFLREGGQEAIVVLELSSFQLGDLPLSGAFHGRMPRFDLAVVTNLLPDHQDYYPSMEAYAADKALIAAGMNEDGVIYLPGTDPWSQTFSPSSPGTIVRAAEIESSALASLAASSLTIPGKHMRRNATVAAMIARRLGVTDHAISRSLSGFGGVPHRLERLGTISGITYVNDSAATIAEAALAAVQSFSQPVHLIAGGSDKGVPLELFAEIGVRVSSLHLLDGSATDRIVPLLSQAGVQYTGPHDSLGAALASAQSVARPESVILLSPGCASFGMFRNEFDRGDQFRALVGAGKA